MESNHSRSLRRPPPGVEEALSSMLWTPYPDSDDSSDEDDCGGGDSEITDSPTKKKRPLTWHSSATSNEPFTIYSPSFLPLPGYSQVPFMVHSYTDTVLHNNQVRDDFIF